MNLTTAFELRRRIVTLLDARSGLDGVKVTRGAPAKAIDAGRQMIFLDAVLDDHDAEYTALGGGRRDEDYILRLIVYVHLLEDDEAAAEARCETLCNEVTTGLHEAGSFEQAPSLPLLRQKIDVSLQELRTDPVEPKGWIAKATVQLRCQALLTA